MSVQQIQAARADAIGLSAQAGSVATSLEHTREGIAGFGDGAIPGYVYLRRYLGNDFYVNENTVTYAGGEFFGTAFQVVATAGVRGVVPEGIKIGEYVPSALKAIQLGERGTQLLVVGGKVVKVGSRVVGVGFTIAGARGVVLGSEKASASWQSGEDAKAIFQGGTAAFSAFQVFQGGRAAFKGWGKSGATGDSAIAPGAERAQQYGENWPSASLDAAIERHAGSNYTSWATKTGKVIYENPSTGRQIVYDVAGDYFRVYQSKTIGGGAGVNLNIDGRIPMPARFTPNGVKNTDLRSLGADGAAAFKAETHYTNTDFLWQSEE